MSALTQFKVLGRNIQGASAIADFGGTVPNADPELTRQNLHGDALAGRVGLFDGDVNIGGGDNERLVLIVLAAFIGLAVFRRIF